jgi:hypothetical protein
MKDLAMHIMDIIQNSLSAEATVVQIDIDENIADNKFEITIKDNGKGMDLEMLKNVTDPYCTSRTTRKVGLGIPLIKQNAELTGGFVNLTSEVGIGTTLTALFSHSHIDRPPLGDIAGTIVLTASANPKVEFVYTHSKDGNSYCFDTREIKAVLDDVPISNLEMIKYLREMIEENLKDIHVKN